MTLLYVKNHILMFLGQNWPEWAQKEIFQISRRGEAWNFSSFLYEVTAT